MIVVTLILYVIGVLIKLGSSFEFELRNMSRVPIVIVFGATGTGKSKLAIKLAKKFNGEIISADSMQVYKGLDIASNKVTQAERAEVRHHMLDVLKPMDLYSVTDYRNQAMPIIEDILKRKKLPIIVGGTNYYIESILWNMLVEPVDANAELVYDRFDVLKDPAHVNQWKTYKGSVLPLRNSPNNLEPLPSVGCDEKTDSDKMIVTKEDVNSLIERIKSVNGEFIRSVQSVQSTMNIAYKYYKRTLYGFGPSTDSQSVIQKGDSNKTESDETNLVDVVKIERTVLKEYISRNLEHAVDFLSNRSDNVDSVESPRLNCVDSTEELNLKDSYTMLRRNEKLPEFGEFSFLNGSHFWNVDFIQNIVRNASENSSLFVDVPYEKYANRLCEICELRQHLVVSCYAIFKKFLDCVIATTTIRIKRLNLIRIIDDYSMLDFDNEELVAELEIVDADLLRAVHPNNRRKLIRALQVYLSSGQTLSDFQKKQRQLEGASTAFGPLRFPDACLLWLCCDQEVLDNRLAERVNEMMEMGLIEELLEFHKQYNVQRLQHNFQADYSRGVFQSIGLKEFHSYLMLNEEQRNSDIGKKLLDEGIKALVQANTQYSRYQTRYMLNKYIKVPETKKVPPVFKLDTTNLSKWEEQVESKAISIVESYLSGSDMLTLEYTPMAKQEPDSKRFEAGQFYCDLCKRLFIGAYQWEAHYRSKPHRKALYKRKVNDLKMKLKNLKQHVNAETAAGEDDKKLRTNGVE